jgi:hypothetical protein
MLVSRQLGSQRTRIALSYKIILKRFKSFKACHPVCGKSKKNGIYRYGRLTLNCNNALEKP